MEFDWSLEKNEILRKSRGITFERIVVAIEEGKAVDLLEHPDPERFSHQRYILVDIDNYIWVVPAIINRNRAFLKTAFPSRKYTALYLKGE